MNSSREQTCQSATDVKCLIFWFEMINCDQWLPLCYLWRLSPRLRTHVFLEAKGLEIHYRSSYGFSGITVDEISEWRRKEENEDLAVHPAATRPAVQLSTRSFGRQQSSEGSSAVGGVVANGAVIENLIKMLKKLSLSSEQRRPPRRPAPNPLWSCGNAKSVWQQQRYRQQWCQYCRGGRRLRERQWKSSFQEGSLLRAG